MTKKSKNLAGKAFTWVHLKGRSKREVEALLEWVIVLGKERLLTNSQITLTIFSLR